MYGKGGLRVFKAELQAAIVDPPFEIYRDAIVVLPFEVTMPILVREI